MKVLRALNNDLTCVVHADIAPGQSTQTPQVHIRPAVTLGSVMYLYAVYPSYMVEPSNLYFMDPAYKIHYKLYRAF